MEDFILRQGEERKEFGVKKFSRTKSDLIICNLLSLFLYLSLSSGAKYKKIKKEKIFRGCWRIFLGKENFSWVFGGVYLEKYWWISRVSLTIDLRTSYSWILCMIWKNAKSFFMWWRFAYWTSWKGQFEKKGVLENQAWSNQTQPAITLSTFISLEWHHIYETQKFKEFWSWFEESNLKRKF